MRFRAILAALLVAQTAWSDDALPRARVLDQQGVRAFQQGRYRDAIEYFEDALKLGGPSSELWNIAKCHQKLDEPELADEALDRYLARGDLSATDRADAEKLRKDIQTRRSPVTVTSSPSGARVAIDGKNVGTTPVTTDVAPGNHQVVMTKLGYAPHEESVTAKWGRGIVIDSTLDHEGGSGPNVHLHTRRFTLEGGFGISFGILGAYGGSALPLGFVSASYAIVDAEKYAVGIGFRFGVTGDSWGNTVGASPNGTGCTTPLPSSFSQAELAAHILATFGWKVRERWRLGGELGFGIVGSTAGGSVGGDVYDSSCVASQGVRPTLHASLDASYRVLPALRLVLRPIHFDIHPAFDGARTVPLDASGPWVRLGFTAGVAIDL